MPLGRWSDCAVFDRLRKAARVGRSSVVVVRGESASGRRGSARDDRVAVDLRDAGADRRPQPATSVKPRSSMRGREHDAGVRRVPGQSPPSRPTRDGPPTAPTGRSTSAKRDEAAWRLIGWHRRQARHGRRTADGRNTPIGRCPPGASDAMIVSAALSCPERARLCATRPRWHTGSGSAWSTGPGVGRHAPSMRVSGEASATIPTLPWQGAAQARSGPW